MSVYVDDFRARAVVGRIRGRWSHLTADTPQELHEFAERIGLQRSWFQGVCKHLGCPHLEGVCRHYHYDVVDTKREAALAAGATALSIREFGDIIRQRQARFRPPTTKGNPS